MKVENLFDYETKVTGATNLILERIKKRDDRNLYSGISINVGLFCGIRKDSDSINNLLRHHALQEKDSTIINRFCGLNAYPIVIRFNQVEDFIKTLQGIELTFSAIRITYIEDIQDTTLYMQIFNDISLPLLSQYYDEIPLYILITILLHRLEPV